MPRRPLWRPRATCGTVAGMSARLLAAAVALAGCDPADEAEAVARDALAAVDGSSAQLSLHDGLLGLVDLRGVAVALAPQQVIAQVEAGLADDLADPDCLALATDRAAYLELGFTDCRYRGVRVDGGLRIDLVAEDGVCDGAPCVVATRYTTRLTRLTVGRAAFRDATSTLRIPTARLEPRSYTAEAALTDAEGREIALRHEIAWVRKLGCVHADLGAEFTVDGRPISVGVAGAVVCGDACPRAGDVQIAWDSGEALAWSFTDAPELVVRGPRGREFTVTRTCDP